MLKFSLVIKNAFQVYTSFYCYSGRVCFKKIAILDIRNPLC